MFYGILDWQQFVGGTLSFSFFLKQCLHSLLFQLAGKWSFHSPTVVLTLFTDHLLHVRHESTKMFRGMMLVGWVRAQSWPSRD